MIVSLQHEIGDKQKQHLYGIVQYTEFTQDFTWIQKNKFSWLFFLKKVQITLFITSAHQQEIKSCELCVTAGASTSGCCLLACLSVYLPQMRGRESGVSHKAASGQHPAGQMNCRQPHSCSSRDYLTWHWLCQPPLLLFLLLLHFCWTILTLFSDSTPFIILGLFYKCKICCSYYWWQLIKLICCRLRNNLI